MVFTHCTHCTQTHARAHTECLIRCEQSIYFMHAMVYGYEDGDGIGRIRIDQNNGLSSAWMHLDAWIEYTNFNTSNTHVQMNLRIFVHSHSQTNEVTKIWIRICNAQCLNKVLVFLVVLLLPLSLPFVSCSFTSIPFGISLATSTPFWGFQLTP